MRASLLQGVGPAHRCREHLRSFGIGWRGWENRRESSGYAEKTAADRRIGLDYRVGGRKRAAGAAQPPLLDNPEAALDTPGVGVETARLHEFLLRLGGWSFNVPSPVFPSRMVFGAGFGWRFDPGKLRFLGGILAERLIVAVVMAVPFAWGLVARPLNPGTHRIRFWNPRPASRFS